MKKKHSRFGKKNYHTIIVSPFDKKKHSCRGLLPLKERSKKITTKWYHSKWIIWVLCIVFFILNYHLYVLSETPSKNAPDYEVSLYKAYFYVFIYFIIVLLLFMIFILYKYHVFFKLAVLFLDRKTMNDDRFLQDIENLESVDKECIKLIRQVLGHIYGLDSQIIYAQDKLSQLSIFGNPCYFELVLGVANKLDLEAPDCDVDRIGKRINKEAKTV